MHMDMLRRKNRPGRPLKRVPAGVRGALLNAAREAFAEQDLRTVSARSIAAAAGVNPAMVHYYFGDKQGLYGALVQESLGPLIVELETLDETTSPDTVMDHYMRLIADNPWLPNLVIREVLYGDGAFREIFVEQFAGRIARALSRLLERKRAGGQLHPDLDPRLATLSLISLAVFPFLARPVVERIFGGGVDEGFLDTLVAHNRSLLDRGLRDDR